MSGGADNIVLDEDALARFMSQIKDPEEKEQVSAYAAKVPVKKMNQTKASKKKKVVPSWKKNLPKKQKQPRKKVVQKPKPEMVQFTAMYIKKGGRGRKTFTFEATDNYTIAKLKSTIAGALANEIKTEHMMLTMFDIPLTHGTLKECGIQDETCLFITDVRTNYTSELDALAGMMRERKAQAPQQPRMERDVGEALAGFLGENYGSSKKSSTKKKKGGAKQQTTSKSTSKTTSMTSRQSERSKLAESSAAKKSATGQSAKPSNQGLQLPKPVNDGVKIDYDKFGSLHLKKLLKERGIEIKTWDRKILIQSLEEDDRKMSSLAAAASRDPSESINPSPPASPRVPPPGVIPMTLSNSKSSEEKTDHNPKGNSTDTWSKKKSKKPKKASGSGKVINMPFKSGPTGKSTSSKTKGKKAKPSWMKEEKESYTEHIVEITYNTDMLTWNKPEEKEAEQKPKKPSKPPPVPVSQTAGPPKFVPPAKPTTQLTGPPQPPAQGYIGGPPPLPKEVQERISKTNIVFSEEKPEKKEQEKKPLKPKTKGPRSLNRQNSAKESHIIVQLGIEKAATVEDMVFTGKVLGSDVRKRVAEKLGVDISKIKLNRANLPIWDTDYLNDRDQITAVIERAKKKQKTKPKTAKLARQADLVRLWDIKSSTNTAVEKKVPDDEYGMPKKGTKTYERMVKAKQWATKKLDQLYVEFPKIPNVKTLPDGTMTATFGDIFEHYQHIDTVIVGTLQSAKKKKLAFFDNKRSFPLLQQRYDDHVVVTLYAR